MTSSIEQGFKDAGIRAIADKIKTRLHDLEKTVDNNKGRWAWELLQNAKDSVADTGRKVTVQIELDQDQVKFRHNGKHFNEQDVIGIINQISSKEVAEGEKSKRVGRFGTGFLTTHLLSKVIEIEGIFESNDGKFSRFNFLLDRNGTTTDILIPKIEKAREDFLKSIQGNNLPDFNPEDFNTSFTYKLDAPEKFDIAKVGTEEFSKLIPFVLAAIQSIYKVEIIDNTKQTKITFENENKVLNENLIEITKTENGNSSFIRLIFAQADNVSIAALIEETERGYEVQSLKDIPKIFCDFPLIGTEKFYFPVVVNSFDFIPQTERNGIWLRKDDDVEVQKNREILTKAVELFKSLLPTLAVSNYYSLFNIVDTRMPEADKNYFDEVWFKDNIQNPLREFIITVPIVDTVRNERVAIVEGESYVDFPYGKNDDETEKIWDLANIEEYFILPEKKDLLSWNNILWNKYRINEIEILSYIHDQENLDTLKESIGKINVIEWLNDVFDFSINVRENLKIFDHLSCLPNENGKFCSPFLYFER